MKTKFLLPLLLAAGAATLFFSSCDSGETKSIDPQMLYREWSLVTPVTKHDSLSSPSDTGRVRITFFNVSKREPAAAPGKGLYARVMDFQAFTVRGEVPEELFAPVEGKWSLSGKDSLLRFSYVPRALQNIAVGEIDLESGSGGSTLYLHDIDSMVTIEVDGDGIRLPPLEEETWKVTELTPYHLAIIHENGRELKFRYDLEESAMGGFSIINILRGLLGMLSLIFIAWVFSANRRAISWKVVGIGLLIQGALALGVLKVPAIKGFFEIIGKMFVVILDFTESGSIFLLGGLLDAESFGFIFAFQVLPTIIFFSALTSLLFYLGIIQKIVYALAWLMTKALRLSGAESLSVAGNIFLGQTESPLMIKAYLEKMTRSEMLLVMSGGMATMAGGVLAAYISFLGGDDPVQRLIFAKHLLAASVMAAPGAVVISKILFPQSENIDQTVKITREKVGSNVLDAISNGTTEGLKLAVNVGAMLLVFIAFIAMMNFILLKTGQWTSLNGVISEVTGGNYNELSLQFLLGYLFAPVMWLIGIGGEDIFLAGRLLGEKIIMTEFIGYVSLAELKAAGAFAHEKSIIMATYMLCGFANFASIGIQIGGIGSLAPGQRVVLSQFGMRALLAGTLAALVSATMVGMILG